MHEFRHFCQNWAKLFKSEKTFDNFVDFNESFFAKLHSGKRGLTINTRQVWESL